MKKMMFLMLTLMFLGAANVNSQVQIGGTNGPDKSAVLDLNPDAGNAKGGLALPRVELTSNTQQLNGATAQPGTVVYNTGSTQLAAGTYVWTQIDGGGGTAFTGISVDNTGTGTTVTGNGTDGSKLKVSVKDGGIGTAQLGDKAVTASKLAQMNASTGQILEWNGSVWTPMSYLNFDYFIDTIPAGTASFIIDKDYEKLTVCKGKRVVGASASDSISQIMPVRYNGAGAVVQRVYGSSTSVRARFAIDVQCITER
jgi:hypothetical protein